MTHRTHPPLSPDVQTEVERLAMHVGLLAHLLQAGTSLTLVTAQVASARGALRDFLASDAIDAAEPGAFVQLDALLPDEVAQLLVDPTDIPDDLSGLDL